MKLGIAGKAWSSAFIFNLIFWLPETPSLILSFLLINRENVIVYNFQSTLYFHSFQMQTALKANITREYVVERGLVTKGGHIQIKKH